jgi:O-antigen ligase
MTLAGVLSLVLLSALPRLLHPGDRRVGRLIAWIVGAGGLGATYVRGAWIGFGAGLLVILALLRRGRTLVIVAAVALGVALVLVPTVRRRAESIVDPNDPTVRERLAMWSSAFRMIYDHPLTGVGPGHVKTEYPRYAAAEFQAKRRGHVHNTPLQIGVERGLIGFAAWIAIFVAFFRRASSVFRGLSPAAGLERALVGGSIAAIAGFLSGGLFEFNFGDSEVVLVAYVVMAIPFVAAETATV